MHLSQFHYLPLAPGFFSILIALFVGLLVIMVVLGAWRHAYLSLGVSPGTAHAATARLADRELFKYTDRGAPAGASRVRQGD
jgi:hypothetical protein